MGRYEGVVVLKDYEPVLAELKELNFEKVWKGSEALEKMFGNVVYAELYKLSKKEVEYTEYMNKSYAVTEAVALEGAEDAVAVHRFENILSICSVSSNEVESLEEFLKTLNDFSGIVYASEKGYIAELYIKDGKIIGARVVVDNVEFKGNSALFYLDRPCKVTVRKSLAVEKLIPDSIRVEDVEDVDIESTIEIDERLDKLIAQIKEVKGRLKFIK